MSPVNTSPLEVATAPAQKGAGLTTRHSTLRFTTSKPTKFPGFSLVRYCW